MPKLFKKNLLNKKTLIFIFGLGLVLSLTPLYSAQALISPFLSCTGPIWDQIGCWIKGVFNVLSMLPVYLFLLPVVGTVLIVAFIGIFVSFLFYAFCSLLLNWVTSPAFVYWHLTQLDNPIIDAGWHLTSGLVNLAFVLILVFIAIATILRLESYGLKKLLPKFLLVVLLINFSLVICGAVVDIANIVTKNFLTPDLGTTFLNVFFRSTPMVGEFFSQLTAEDMPCISGETVTCGTRQLVCPTEGKYSCTCPIGNAFFCALDSLAQSFTTLSGLIGTLVKAFGAILFGFFGGFVLLLYVLLFMIRIIVLWLLAILAPIAWACWILPFTKGYFKTWWNYFLQWAFVGAIGGFFLYLSGVMVGQLELGLFSPTLTVPGDSPATQVLYAIFSPIATVLGGLFALGAVLAFMIIGFILSIKTAGGGTEAVLKLGEKGLKTVGAGATALAQKRLAGPAAERAAEGMRAAAGLATRLEERAGKAKGIGRAGKPFAQALRWTTRGAEMTTVPTLRKYAAKMRRANWAEMFRGMNSDEIAKMIDSFGFKDERVSAAAWLAEQGILDKAGVTDTFKKQRAQEAKELSTNPLQQKDAVDLLETLTRFVDVDTIVGLETEPEAKEKLQAQIDEKVRGITPPEIEAVLKVKVDNDLKRDKNITPKEPGEAGYEEYEREFNEARRALPEGTINQELRDAAAREIWVGNLKTGDVKDIEKKSFRLDVGTRRGTRNWSSSHYNALIGGFKKDDVEQALNKPGGINAMFEGKTPEQARAIADELYDKNSRLFHFFATNPAGREWAFRGLDFMTDPFDQPTASFADYEKRKGAERIVKDNATLESTRNLFKSMARLRRDLTEATGGEVETDDIKEQITGLRDRINVEKERFLRGHPESQKLWEELESLMEYRR